MEPAAFSASEDKDAEEKENGSKSDHPYRYREWPIRASKQNTAPPDKLVYKEFQLLFKRGCAGVP